MRVPMPLLLKCVFDACAMYSCTIYELITYTSVFKRWRKNVGYANVCSAENLTKGSNNTLLRLVRFSAEQTLRHGLLNKSMTRVGH